MATLESLQEKIAKLQAQAEAISKKQSANVIGEIRSLMEKHGITTADIDSHPAAKKRGRKAEKVSSGSKPAAKAKYRDLKTGATWSGHGRAPAWIASAKDRNKFLIDGSPVRSSAASSKVSKAAVKSGNYVRGPQDPKYRDPNSGATWSGRGPAPAWLASAQDRTKFLIESASGDNGESTVSASKKVAAKKLATKKGASKKAA